MGAFGSVRATIDRYLTKKGAKEQGKPAKQAYRDARDEAGGFSVESMVARSLADLACTGLDFQCSGTSERAQVIDAIGDRFVRRTAVTLMKQGLQFGDALCIPVLGGRGIEHAVVSVDDFRILACAGDEITDVAYVVQRKRTTGHDYALVQEMRLEPYTAQDGTRTSKAVMELSVVSGDGGVLPVSGFPDWAGEYEPRWEIPNCPHLPLGRLKSFAEDSEHPNSIYGVPICHGASQFIREIHYLVEQEHAEFELSEKGVIADKTMFIRDGNDTLSLPKGRQRLFMKVNNGSRSLDASQHIDEWAPSIQLSPYEEAIEQQLRLVERAVGVDSGVVSKPENVSYENVDAVRKSSRKTQAFVEAARDRMEECMSQLVYAWDVLLNLRGFPTGEYSVKYSWSDDYINTYSDQREALVAGYSMGATDALDYRLFVTGEPVETARARVEEIQAGRSASVILAE